MAVNRVFPAISQTGGVQGSLDNISVNNISHDDMAIVRHDSLDSIAFYRFDTTSSDGASDKVVVPLDAGANGRWLLLSPNYFVENVIIEQDNRIETNNIYGYNTPLDVGYQNGSPDMTFGSLEITVSKDMVSDSTIESTVSTGTAPFVVASTTVVANFNAELHGGETIDNISLLDGTGNAYSVLPQVTDSVTVVPTVDADLTTKAYVDSVAIGMSDHGSLSNLTDPTHHPQYSLVDGTVAFTGKVQGQTTAGGDPAATLTTKDYVDGLIGGGSISHSALLDLVGPADDHTQYILVDGTRGFTGVVSGISPTDPNHLVTKDYVDTLEANFTLSHSDLSDFGSDDHIEYILANSSRPFENTVNYPRVSSSVTLPSADSHLTTKIYVDTVISDGTISHGNLSDLGVDDHTQYSLVDGSRAFTGKVQGVSTLAGDPAITLTTKDYVDNLNILDTLWEKVSDVDSPVSTASGAGYFADVTTAGMEFRAPAAPTIGARFVIDDYQNNSGTNNISVNDDVGGNLLVEGSSSTPMVIDVDGARVEFIYVDATYGWRYKVI